LVLTGLSISEITALFIKGQQTGALDQVVYQKLHEYEMKMQSA
jgi:hypothetical protein